MEKKLEVLSILVKNHYGVLTRISSLFGRRGFNIDTFTASASNDPEISTITISLKGDHYEIEQIIAQTLKLEEVISVKVLNPNEAVIREIALVKVEANPKTRGQIKDAADIYGASVVDLSPDSMMLELTGKPIKIDAFINLMEDFNIIEMCRTGVTAMSRIK